VILEAAEAASSINRLPLLQWKPVFLWLAAFSHQALMLQALR